jgi:hypothetical protein
MIGGNSKGRGAPETSGASFHDAAFGRFKTGREGNGLDIAAYCGAANREIGAVMEK